MKGYVTHNKAIRKKSAMLRNIKKQSCTPVQHGTKHDLLKQALFGFCDTNGVLKK